MRTYISIVLLFIVRAAFGQDTGPVSRAVPSRMDRPYVKLFTLIGGGQLARTDPETIASIAKDYGWINSHGGYWLKDFLPDKWQYPFGPSAGTDRDGKSVAQQLRSLNPDIILTNYRNGSYTSQGGLKEAGEVESRCPLAIAVHDTSATLVSGVDAQETVIKVIYEEKAPENTPNYYPFIVSTTENEYSLNKKEYVAWLRLDDEILRINNASTSDGIIFLSVKRGIWNTKPVSHSRDAKILAPIYCGSKRKDGTEYYLSGLPGGVSGIPDLRYIMMQDNEAFWEFLNEKSNESFAEGYNGPWYDCTISIWINHSNAYGVKVNAPYDIGLERELDRETYREYQQRKLDYLFERNPKREFYVNWIFPKFYFANGHEKLMFSGENGHHQISGGAIEMYGNEKFMNWHDLMRMQIDMRDNNYRVACWVKRADTGSDLKMDDKYRFFAYTTHLLVYEPGVEQYWGAQWPDGSLQPPDLVYYDLGRAQQKFNSIDEAELNNSPGVYQRLYDKGRVLVNPSESESRTVSLNEELYDVQAGTWVTQVVMPPLSGNLLIKP